MGNVAAGGLKIFTGAIATASTGVAALGTAAIKSYADYEQLIGGAELMFGDAFDFIADKAENAYSTVQMSQNEYLQQVNGFATGLKTALGGNAQAAAELADKIITAEADIVAATGNSAENVQNAFNGIMKSNYTMLDNLLIGISPTKEGMQEVIDKVNEWNAAQGKATAYTIDNVADCQSAVIDYIDMVGMSGYASAEASKTISGSVASMKASWSNLLTGIADDSQNFDALVNNFVESVGITAGNLLPRIETVIVGASQLIESLLPVVVARIPEIINNVIPDLLQSGANVIKSLVEGIRINIGVISSSTTELTLAFGQAFTELSIVFIQFGMELLSNLMVGIIQNLPALMENFATMFSDINEILCDWLPDLIKMGIEIVAQLVTGIAQALPELSTSLVSMMRDLIGIILDELGEVCPAINPITDALQFLIDNFDAVLAVIVPLTSAFAAWKAVLAVSSLIDAVKKALNGMTIAQYAAKKAQDLLNTSMLANPITLIVMAIAALVAAFIYLWNNCEAFREFWINLWENIKETFKNVVDAIVGFFTETIPAAFNGFIDFIKNNWESLLALLNPATMLAGIFGLVYENCEGFRAFVDEFVQSIKEFFENAWNSIVEFFTVGIPEFISDIGTWFSELPELIAYWLGYAIGSVIKWGLDLGEWIATNVPIFIDTIVTFFSELPGKIEEFFDQIIAKAIVWGVNMALKAAETGSKFVNNIIEFFRTLPQKISDFLENIIKKATKFAVDMAEKARKAGKDFYEKTIEKIKELPGKIAEYVGNIITKATEFVSNFGAKAKEAGKNFFDNILNELKSLPDKMVEVGANIISGIWDGISSGWDWLLSKIGELANSLIQGAKDALGIHSPSREFALVGKMCVAGFDEGIEDLMNPDSMVKNVNASLSVMKANVNGAMAGWAGEGQGGFVQNNYIYQKISTPDELARTLRIESKYGLMEGVPIG